MVKRRGNGFNNGEPSTSSEGNESDFERVRRQHRRPNQQQPSTPNPVDNPEILLQMFMEVVKKIWQHIKQASSFLMVEMHGYQIFDKIAQWCARNPNITIVLVAGCAVMFLPFLIFLGFCLSTVVLTFTGLLFLEGTLLTVLSMLLFACIGALAIALIFLSIIGVAGYFGFSHIYNIYGGLGRHKAVLKNIILKEKQNLNNYLIEQQSQRSPTTVAGESSVQDV